MDTFRRNASRLVISVLVLISIALGFYGADHLTQATLGVGVLCAGVLVAVLARISQAADHHAELRRILDRKA